jgi:hypothetical protein
MFAAKAGSLRRLEESGPAEGSEFDWLCMRETWNCQFKMCQFKNVFPLLHISLCCGGTFCGGPRGGVTSGVTSMSYGNKEPWQRVAHSMSFLWQAHLFWLQEAEDEMEHVHDSQCKDVQFPS